MNLILRQLQPNDLKYFAQWWQDEELIKYTSGNFEELSDEQIKKYFEAMLNSKKDYHWMIETEGQTIGHVNLSKRNIWYETQIIIGEKEFWNKGYGSAAIKQIVQKASELNINHIYLEVRPENLRAIRAYEKAGFTKIKTIKYPDNPNLPETIRMEYLKSSYQ